MQPAGLDNHKAGWIGFRSSDPGQRYIATGDEGGGNIYAVGSNGDSYRIATAVPEPGTWAMLLGGLLLLGGKVRRSSRARRRLCGMTLG